MNLRPLEFNILVRQDPVEEKTKGGLMLPMETQDKAKHHAQRGTIVALSPMAFNEDIWPPDADRPKPGDRVVYAQHAGTWIKEAGEEFRMMKDRDVLAVIHE